MKSALPHRRCPVCAFWIVSIALVLLTRIPAGQALKPGEVSLAAEMTAGLRAVAAMDPDEKVRGPDYLAEKFLSPNFWFFGALSKDYRKSRSFIAAYRISRYYTVNAVTHHIDGILKDMAAKNLAQVVIIGAGFDSRPYRFEKDMPAVRFYEVDLPATQIRKKEQVSAVLGGLPNRVTYVPIDYRTRPIFAALKRAGYDEKLKSLFIWEGTTRFTDPRVADHTLRAIAEHSAAGSAVVFDYIFDAVARGDYSKYRGARFPAVRMAAGGEPLRFGIAEGRAEAYVTHRGLKVVSDLGPRELALRYLVRSNGTLDGKPTPYARVMHAVVGR